MKIVVCGGGIIGCSIAYYLTKEGETEVTLVERVEVAGQASGKAGGFLARDWCDHGPVGPLAHKSFELHEQLAKELEQDVGYRKVDTLSVSIGEDRRVSAESIPSWIDGNVRDSSSIGDTSTTAQVHPRQLSLALVESAQKHGATVIIDEVVGVQVDDSHKVTGVRLADGSNLPADVVVVAMGPWSDRAREWFPKTTLPKIRGSRAHSIVMKPQVPISSHALFLSGLAGEPEIYPRPDGTVYMCGNGDREPLPSNPADVTANPRSCQDLHDKSQKVSKHLKEAQVVTSQACYLPSGPDGLPILGRIPNYDGAFLATGHTCWGILNAPATGAAMAELIVKGQATVVDLSAFDPKRFV